MNADAPLARASVRTFSGAMQRAATLLAAFLLNKEGQDILYKTERSSSHLVKGTQMNKFVAEQEKRGVKFVSYTVSEVMKNAEEHSRIRQKFQKILAGN